MRKMVLAMALLMGCAIFSISSKAQDIINLASTDNISTVLSSYTGSNLILVVPTGYTNPQGTTAITLASTLKSGIKITFRGDGTMPNLSLSTFTVPSTGLNFSALKFENLTLTGTSTTSYMINVSSGTLFNADTVSFNGCNINTFRSLVRFQSTNATTIEQKANYIQFNNCKVNNCSDYGVVYNNKVGASFGPIVVKNSTFYGYGQTIFLCQTNTASVSISDCTFDNFTVVPGTSPRYVVDLGTQNSPIVVKNCIFGLTTTTKYSKGFKTGGTIAITNSYRTSDCFYSVSDSIVATGGVTGSIVAYPKTASSVFKTPSTSAPGSNFSNIADYTIIDKDFPGITSAGDPRWNGGATGVNAVKAANSISYKGTQISLNDASDVSIFNSTGKLVKTASQVNALSVSDLQKGIYIVKAGNALQKIVVR